jgi:hypothetical protein
MHAGDRIMSTWGVPVGDGGSRVIQMLAGSAWVGTTVTVGLDRDQLTVMLTASP